MKLLAVVYADRKRLSGLSDDERRALAAVACIKLVRQAQEEAAA
ncbi:MAG TPA: hypothetical protein VIR59_15945 [Gaiellaceae bacterium]|jgi:hypothetical protein